MRSSDSPSGDDMVLGFLKGRENFVSGSEIALTLEISRVAVWKKIARLRQRGYTIEASPSKGYRLIKSPDLSSGEIISSLSGPGRIGKEITFFASAVSTNTLAMELASKGSSEGNVIIADSQTGGKGRLGRVWISPPGKNLYMSIILKPDIHPQDSAILTLMPAVACASALNRLLPVPVSIKWPNDIMVSGKKLGGILTEMKADTDRVNYAVIGIGLNINIMPGDLPAGVRQSATSMRNEADTVFNRTAVAVEILNELDKWYAIFLEKGKNPVLEKWSQLSSTLGHTVQVTTVNEVFTGFAEDIDDYGMLILRMPDKSLKKISSGDVTHASLN